MRYSPFGHVAFSMKDVMCFTAAILLFCAIVWAGPLARQYRAYQDSTSIDIGISVPETVEIVGVGVTNSNTESISSALTIGIDSRYGPEYDVTLGTTTTAITTPIFYPFYSPMMLESGDRIRVTFPNTAALGVTLYGKEEK